MPARAQEALHRRDGRVRIGVVGTGFIGRGLSLRLASHPRFDVSRILTRTDPTSRSDFPLAERLTRSVDELIERSELIVECSGDVVHATEVIERALAAGRPVVTMNAEFHVTVGSWFAARGANRPVLTEAEGDQPGCLAALAEHAREMGFAPRVYGNVKGFLDENPSEGEMRRWAARLGISIAACTAFTDGTKVQIEQALVANGLGADIARPGLIGDRCDELAAGAARLAAEAESIGRPIADYVLAPNVPAGVFVVASHDASQRDSLRYLKQGDGPNYTLLRGYHLVHLEIPRTIDRVLRGGGVLLDNSASPRVSVAAVTKRALGPGTRIERGIGGLDVRGRAVRVAEARGHVPIGLLSGAIVKRAISAGDVVTSDAVELPESRALHAWRAIDGGTLSGA